jgi:FkbM family methyltransferase
MKRSTRLISIRHTPMMIFESPECISDDIVKHHDFWEFELFNKWCEYFPEKGLMLDIGANIGSHCLQFRDNFPKLEIYAFEPFQENFNLLKQNTQRYSNIKCFNLGIGSRNSIVHFNNGHEFNSGVVSIVPESENPNIVLALDTFNFDKKVEFIKIDVEGHELSAFEGMKELLLKDKPLIWLEDNEHNAVSYLQSLGYKIIQQNIETNDFLMI